MKNRFFIDADLAEGGAVALSDEERHHARVLRVRDGEAIEVFNGRGDSFDAVYESGEIRLTNRSPNREPDSTVHLAMAIINLEKFELVLQKATELGIASIIPMVTERCEIRPERYRGKLDRWQKIVFEAVKQSGRARIPRVEEPRSFKEVIEAEGEKIIFDADTPRTTEQPDNRRTLMIGPEGGWSENEIRMAQEADCRFEQLGPRRLRAETAAIVATALALR
jgi:16S rRNA (uracil1498-N3)-methyltransferase